MLVAAGLIALIGWQSVPFLSSKVTPQKKAEPEAAKQETKSEPPPQPVAEAAPPDRDSRARARQKQA